MKLKMAKTTKVITMGILGIAAVTGISLAINESRTQHTSTNEKSIFNYSNEEKAGYQVNVASDELYDFNALGENQYYMSDYVGSIEAEFQDDYKGSQKVEIEGNYKVTSELRGYTTEYEGEKEVKYTVWSKKSVTQEEKSFKEETDQYNIDEKVKVDIQPYIKFIKQLAEEKQYGMPTELIVRMEGKKLIHTPKEVVEMPIDTSLTIPINETYFRIEKEVPEAVKDEQKETVTVIEPTNTAYIVECGVVSGLSVIACIMIGVFGKEYSEREKYERRIKRIFTEHGSRMVGVDKLNKGQFENAYYVTKIEDLVKLADELEKPIIYIKEQETAEIDTLYIADSQNLYILKFEKPDEEEIELSKEEKQKIKQEKKEERRKAREEKKKDRLMKNQDKKVESEGNGEAAKIN